mmetsp:Transcript_8929/g.19270  ORF Transcript_8929/g.19270 Transcript_8929/m.19270 type:complete len:99 (-) Transcript_8929:177-473(-)
MSYLVFAAEQHITTRETNSGEDRLKTTREPIASDRTSIVEKKEIAGGILQTVRLDGGRFLFGNRMGGEYDILEDNEVTARILQCLHTKKIMARRLRAA